MEHLAPRKRTAILDPTAEMHNSIKSGVSSAQTVALKAVLIMRSLKGKQRNEEREHREKPKGWGRDQHSRAMDRRPVLRQKQQWNTCTEKTNWQAAIDLRLIYHYIWVGIQLVHGIPLLVLFFLTAANKLAVSIKVSTLTAIIPLCLLKNTFGAWQYYLTSLTFVILRYTIFI